MFLQSSTYHPVWFYSIVLFFTFALCPLALYFGTQKGLEKFQLLLLLIGLAIPCITALVMIYTNESLIADFWKRLFHFNIGAPWLFFILTLMPAVIYLATSISLLFGQSSEQFSLNQSLSAIKGWPLLGLLLPIVLAPLIEELGWRGYGVDSLRAYFNLFNTSILFGLLWAAWHLPPFFVKGSYQNELWDQGIVYVINFFVSVFVIAFLMNWVYYKTDRSIPAIVLFHAVLNLASMALQTTQFTKCIGTGLLCLITTLVIFFDREYFFKI